MVICLERGADSGTGSLLTWAVPDKGPLNGCVCVESVLQH